MKTLQELRKGDSLRADWLNGIVRQVNANTRLLRQFSESNLSDFGRTAPYTIGGGGGGTGGALPTSLTLTEVSRTSATYVVTTSSGDTVDLMYTTKVVMTGYWNGATANVLAATTNYLAPT